MLCGSDYIIKCGLVTTRGLPMSSGINSNPATTTPYISHPARAGQHTPGLALAFVLVISTLIGIIGLLSGTYCLPPLISHSLPLASHLPLLAGGS